MPSTKKAADSGGKEMNLEKPDLEALSQFRYQLRSFLRLSEDAAREAGITALQYQLLLHTQGFEGRDWATISELAERLQAQLHGVVALVTRCEEAGLIRRETSSADRRQVEIHLVAKGRKLLAKLATMNIGRLSDLASAVQAADRAARTGSTPKR